MLCALGLNRAANAAAAGSRTGEHAAGLLMRVLVGQVCSGGDRGGKVALPECV